MIRAGEQGGFLEVVLSQIADFRTREADLKGKVKAALVYPIMLALMAVMVLVGMLTWFIPKFSDIFKQFGGNLPALTQVHYLRRQCGEALRAVCGDRHCAARGGLIKQALDHCDLGRRRSGKNHAGAFRCWGA